MLSTFISILLPWMAVAFVASYIVLKVKRLSQLPSGPYGLPVIGYLHKFGEESLHVIMYNLSKIYGDLFSIQLGQRLTMVLSSKHAIYEAYTKKAKLFAGRPDFASFTNTSHGSVGISLCSYDKVFEYNRKNVMRAIHHFYGQKESFDKLLQKENTKMINFFDSCIATGKPVDPMLAFKVIVPSAFLSMMFGKDFEYTDTEFLEIVERYNEWFENAEADNPPDFFPLLMTLPNKRLKIIGDCGEAFEAFATKQLKEYEMEPNNNSLVHSLCEDVGTISTLTHQQQRNLARIVADLCGGGFDTVASTLAWAPLYLLEKRNVLEKCREEIISVFNSSQVLYEERESVPYFTATVYDILRHSTVAPLALPRVTMDEVKLRECTIPKNTMVFSNLWACNHDPKEWKETDFLHPENFLIDSALDQDAIKKLLTFSSGVRRCPAERIACHQIFALLGTMIQTFDFEMKDAPQDKLPKKGLTLKPKEYKLTLKRYCEPL